MHLSVSRNSVKVKWYLLIWIFDKETDLWIEYTYDTSGHKHSAWKTTFLQNIWRKRRSIYWIKEHVHTEQQKHLSELILPAKHVLVSSSRTLERGQKGLFIVESLDLYIYFLFRSAKYRSSYCHKRKLQISALLNIKEFVLYLLLCLRIVIIWMQYSAVKRTIFSI